MEELLELKEFLLGNIHEALLLVVEMTEMSKYFQNDLKFFR